MATRLFRTTLLVAGMCAASAEGQPPKSPSKMAVALVEYDKAVASSKESRDVVGHGGPPGS